MSLIVLCLGLKEHILILHMKKIINLIIKTFENKISQNSIH